MTNSDCSIFDILLSDAEEFSTLLSLARLDCASDLQEADLSGIDFGELTGDVLDLSGCDLTGANLANVKFRQIILDGALTDNARLPPNLLRGPPSSRIDTSIRQFALCIHRFGLDNDAPFRAWEAMRDNRYLLLPYSDFAEQDFLTKELSNFCAQAFHNVAEFTSSGAKEAVVNELLVVKAATSTWEAAVSVFDADTQFSMCIQSDSTSAVSSIFDSRTVGYSIAPPSSPSRLKKGHPVSVAGAIADYLNKKRKFLGGRIFIFSGIAPPSLSYLQAAAVASEKGSNWVFIVPELIVPQLAETEISKRIYPKLFIVRNSNFFDTRNADRFLKRLHRFEEYGIRLSPESIGDIKSSIGSSLPALKNRLLKRLFAAVSKRASPLSV